MPVKRKTTKIGKQKRPLKAVKHGEAKRHEGQATAKPVAMATKPANPPANPYARQNFFRLTDPHVRKIGHGSNGFLPKYRRTG